MKGRRRFCRFCGALFTYMRAFVVRCGAQKKLDPFLWCPSLVRSFVSATPNKQHPTSKIPTNQFSSLPLPLTTDH